MSGASCGLLPSAALTSCGSLMRRSACFKLGGQSLVAKVMVGYSWHNWAKELSRKLRSSCRSAVCLSMPARDQM